MKTTLHTTQTAIPNKTSKKLSPIFHTFLHIYNKKWGEFKVQIVADDPFFWYNKLDILSAKLAPCFFQKSRKNTGHFAVLRLYSHFTRK